MKTATFSRNKYIFASIPQTELVKNTSDKMKKNQVITFIKDLSSYNIILKDLVNYPLNEQKRTVSLNVAFYIMENEKLSKMLQKQKELPLAELKKCTRLSEEYLKNIRDFAIAYFLLISDKKYKVIKDTLHMGLKEDMPVNNGLVNKRNLFIGITLKPYKRTAVILTPRGEFVKIKTRYKMTEGQVCDGRRANIIMDYKIHIAVFLTFLIFLSTAIVIDYQTTKTIIVLETTSNIKMHVNKYNKVIYIHSDTEKGKELVEEVNGQNEKLDIVLEKILEYGTEKEMVGKSKEILLTVSGNPLEYGELEKTNKFVKENNIPFTINNAGNLQTMPDLE